MTPILVLEAFGNLPSTLTLDAERERERLLMEKPPTGISVAGLLHVAVESRTELMGWRNLWNLFEAGLTGDDGPSMIGWVYVSLSNPADLNDLPPDSEQTGWATFPASSDYGNATVPLPAAILPLLQCFDDALRHLGAVDVSGFQVSCYGAHRAPRKMPTNLLIANAGWFDAPEKSRADALITFDYSFLGDPGPAALIQTLQGRRTGSFDFAEVAPAPTQHRINASSDTPFLDVAFEPAELGLSVVLPEWSPCAAGWALSMVVDAAQSTAPDAENFVIRITRTGLE